MQLQETVRRRTASIVPPIAVLFLSFVSAVYGQFTSGVNLVEVYATVTDQRGEPVGGLTASDFRVLEDGVPQTISTFAAGEFPLAIAVGIDRSFSMGGKSNRLAVAKSAAHAFVSAMRPGDQVMVLAIGSETEVAAPLSTDRTAAFAAIDRLDAWGTTPLYDATLVAMDAVQAGKGRRALVLLSDGNDRYSDTTATDLVDQARRRDVLVYPVAIGPTRPPVFAELAAATGGRSFYSKDPRELNGMLEMIARELRMQYLLGYAPAANERSAWRSIDVQVDRPNVRVRARDGYYFR
jgi:Ca-activated chloride channel homolog